MRSILVAAAVALFSLAPAFADDAVKSDAAPAPAVTEPAAPAPDATMAPATDEAPVAAPEVQK